jgi:small subunit ribosomal protein S16
MVKIRLQRGGRTHRPVYTIVAANSRAARNGKFLEKLGQYNPNEEVTLSGVKVEEIKVWISKGAQITDTVRSLFKRNGIKLS